MPASLRKSVGILLAHPDRSGIWLSKRLPKSPPTQFDGCIATPGGKVDDGEFIEAAIRRETEEETGLRLGALALVAEGTFTGTLGTYYCYHFFGETFEEPENLEPDKHGPWEFYRTEDLLELPLMESTREAINVALQKGLLVAGGRAKQSPTMNRHVQELAEHLGKVFLRTGGIDARDGLYAVAKAVVELKCQVMGPDGFTLAPEPHENVQEALQFSTAWITRFVKQGYYSDARRNHLTIEEVIGSLQLSYVFDDGEEEE